MKNAIILILLSFSLSAMAQMTTDRPDQTESSSTVELGALQIETGVLAMYTEVGPNTVRHLLTPTALARYGLFEGIELRLTSQVESSAVRNRVISEGISDIQLGAKVQILQKPDVNTEVAFLSHLVIPSGTREVSADRIGTINRFALSHSLNDRLGLGYNIGYNYLDDGNGDLTFSVSLGIAINDRVGIYFEPYGEWIDMKDANLNFDAGGTYSLFEFLQLDLSFGTGLNNEMNYVSAGISWKFLRGKKEEE